MLSVVYTHLGQESFKLVTHLAVDYYQLFNFFYTLSALKKNILKMLKKITKRPKLKAELKHINGTAKMIFLLDTEIEETKQTDNDILDFYDG